MHTTYRGILNIMTLTDLPRIPLEIVTLKDVDIIIEIRDICGFWVAGTGKCATRGPKRAIWRGSGSISRLALQGVCLYREAFITTTIFTN